MTLSAKLGSAAASAAPVAAATAVGLVDAIRFGGLSLSDWTTIAVFALGGAFVSASVKTEQIGALRMAWHFVADAVCAVVFTGGGTFLALEWAQGRDIAVGIGGDVAMGFVAAGIAVFGRPFIRFALEWGARKKTTEVPQ